MTRRVDFLPEARADLVRLADFLAGRNPDAATDAMEAILAGAGSLSTLANRGAPAMGPNARKHFVPFGRSAYVIIYQVQSERVLITRVFHGLEDRPLA